MLCWECGTFGMWDLASKNGSLGVGVLKKEVLKVTSESGFNLSSLLPVCSHWVNSTTSYCCHDPRHLCHHAFPTIMDCTSFFWFSCQVKVSKVINTLFISIICNRTQNGKSTEETKGRPGISDSGTGCEVQDRCLGEGQISFSHEDIIFVWVRTEHQFQELKNR